MIRWVLFDCGLSSDGTAKPEVRVDTLHPKEHDTPR
jgi:hypothetical protein